MTKPYQPEMTELQLSFFRALCAPFPNEALSEKPGRGGKPMTWLDKRALANRLDSVCTPLGWTVEYRPTQRGFTARMGILMPTHDGEWTWVHKEDGAGYEEMGAVDDDEKSGYTNSFRRVAQDGFGIGRYLYRKGVPSFWAPDVVATWDLPPIVSEPAPAPPIEVPAARKPAPRGVVEEPARGPTSPHDAPGRTVEGPAQSPAAPAPAAKQAPSSGIDPVLLKIPAAGRPMFGWVKGVEDYFQTSIKNGVVYQAEKLGGTRFMNQWSQEIVDVVVMDAIRHIRTQENYGGEFEHLIQEAPSGNAPPLPARNGTASPATNAATSTVAPAPSTTESAASSAPPAPRTSSVAGQPADVVEARKQTAAALLVYIAEVHGEEKPAPARVKGFIEEMSADAVNGFGQTGEVMHSINACADLVWLNNLTSLACEEVRKFREKLAAEKAVEDEIPF